ncbi:MAG: hypothetical protein AMS21_01115 [Gemmatimonas sp. SG8_38_2]|nr:MAG: hypothetical protein AMS21_01115 [Gemmatimonas sp. SG8_38_2]
MAKVKLRRPVEPGVKIIDRTGKTRGFGVPRKKLGYRMKRHVYEAVMTEAINQDRYFQDVLDEIIDKGCDALKIKTVKGKKK